MVPRENNKHFDERLYYVGGKNCNSYKIQRFGNKNCWKMNNKAWNSDNYSQFLRWTSSRNSKKQISFSIFLLFNEICWNFWVIFGKKFGSHFEFFSRYPSSTTHILVLGTSSYRKKLQEEVRDSQYQYFGP